MKLVVIESKDLKEESQCTLKQFQFARDLLFKAKRETELNSLTQFGRIRLTKKSASNLIDMLINEKEFELRQLKR
jgi:hypothetical protein